MIFIDPTVDLAFKKLFGDRAKTEIPISFLNSVLGRKEGEKIVKLTISDPVNHPSMQRDKYSISLPAVACSKNKWIMPLDSNRSIRLKC